MVPKVNSAEEVAQLVAADALRAHVEVLVLLHAFGRAGKQGEFAVANEPRHLALGHVQSGDGKQDAGEEQGNQKAGDRAAQRPADRPLAS